MRVSLNSPSSGDTGMVVTNEFRNDGLKTASEDFGEYLVANVTEGYGAITCNFSASSDFGIKLSHFSEDKGWLSTW